MYSLFSVKANYRFALRKFEQMYVHTLMNQTLNMTVKQTAANEKLWLRIILFSHVSSHIKWWTCQIIYIILAALTLCPMSTELTITNKNSFIHLNIFMNGVAYISCNNWYAIAIFRNVPNENDISAFHGLFDTQIHLKPTRTRRRRTCASFSWECTTFICK